MPITYCIVYAALLILLTQKASTKNSIGPIRTVSVLNPFFCNTYEVKDEYRGSNAVDLARSVNCISCIQETAVLDPDDIDVLYCGDICDIEQIIQDITITR